jgi:hypothetical protein
VIKETQKVEVKKLYDFSNGTSLDFDLNFRSGLQYYYLEGGTEKSYAFHAPQPSPKVKITFTPVSDFVTTAVAKPATAAEVPVFNYRIPAPYKITAEISDNKFTGTYTAFEEIVLVPQKGTLTSIQIPFTKGKNTIEVKFNTNTGNLEKYAVKKESTIKASLASVKASSDELGTAVNKLRDEQAKSKKDVSLENEISKLKLEVEKLQLQKQKNDLSGVSQ